MNKKVFLNGRFLTQPVTGVQRTAHELIKALDKLLAQDRTEYSGFDFILLCPKGKIPEIKLARIRFVQKGLLKGNLWEQAELPVYTFGHLLISMGSISALLKRKQVVIVHDAGTFSNPAYFKVVFRNWYRVAIRILSRTALQIITVSEYSKAQLVKYTGIAKDKVTVIYNAADHIAAFGEASEEFKKKADELKPFMLGVSSLHPHKNFEVLSQAISRTPAGKYKIVIAGGTHPKSFQSIALDKSVILLGYVTDAQLKYLYSNAEMFVFPSLFEGFGIPPLEAMTVGCPVLASTATAVPEILGDACEYFDPRSADDLICRITSLSENKERLRELRQKGYERAAMYSWHKSAHALFDLIKKFAK